ncbi:thioredoxin family protein [Roseicyclus persicicus]|uniref:Thioredoxin family protein n=1 Tax=Roseicyclus persicicus TaxID=2650661 RepID=A0A7X6H027_9RHOB|nr:thioredoxin family protein [Roseibacterium persicicum]NKX44899.1 thioredoxin family protein [Roseibacterium persicicum]
MIDRRSLIAALALLPLAGRARAMIDYTPGLVRDRLAAGETVFVDFSATWCSTCRTQGRIIESLRSANPAYDAAMTFVKVDWDTHGTGELAQSLAIPRRSTLVLLRGDTELGRIVAGTREVEIRALLDLGLA